MKIYLVPFVALTLVSSSPLQAAVVTLSTGASSGYTMMDGNTYVISKSLTFSNSSAGGSGITIADNATVVIYIPAGVTLTAKGANGSGQTGGGAGIRVPSSATLIITGEGAVNATGGNAGNGEKGSNGTAALSGSGSGGTGGKGGCGGGGAGAAIGGIGGLGGGSNGGYGREAETMGKLYLLGSITAVCFGGNNGTAGSGGVAGTANKITKDEFYGGGGGGGGGGAGARPSCAIGGGGSSGGGGTSGGDGGYRSNGASGHGGFSTVANGSSGGGAYCAPSDFYGSHGGVYGAEGDAGTLYVSPTATVNVNRTILSATTHQAAQYTITFEANGGIFPSFANAVTATLGCALPNPILSATKEGYWLVGWAGEPTGETMWYDADGTEMLSSYAVPSNTTLYAVWGQPEAPVFSPAGGVVPSWPLSVTIFSTTEGAVIHYTTDGSEPTADSPVYRRFRISGRTTVKAIAVKDGACSNVAVAEYVGGLCAAPVITAASSFTGAEAKVSISCATPGATIRYTLDGNDPNSHSTRYTGPFYVTNSCMVKAYAVYPDYFDSEVVSLAVEKVWGIGDTLGAPDHTFTTGGNLPFVRVSDATAPLGEAMQSGAITHKQSSTMTTTVNGSGTISFQWKTSCEDSDGFYDWDHAEFWVDDTRIAQLDGETAWQTVTQDISGGGSHTLLWKYVKDDMSSEGEDCCWVADYRWASDLTETQTTETPVPYDWLRDFFPHTPDEYDSYESAALDAAANGVNKVWECYVAGLCPTNATQVFRAVISWENSEPKISWEPKLAADEEVKRVYTEIGKTNLNDNGWTDVSPANRDGMRFFKVKVEMRQ